jgi:hypothetical protein
MSSKTYLPRAYPLLLSWLVNFMSYLIANLTRFGVPDAKLEPLRTQTELFQAAYAKAEQPNAGKADRLDRREKAATVSRTVRDFVNENLRYNRDVTDEDRVKLGLVVPDETPTPSHDPDTMPVVVSIDSSVIMRITLHFKDSHRTSRAKPRGIHGAEIRWRILDAPPSTTDELIHSEFATRSSRTFIFEENMRGKTVWFRLRWESNRGQKGPWSELYSAVIP